MRTSCSILLTFALATLTCGVGLFASSLPASANSSLSPKPNVLLVVTDDIGIDQIRTFGYGGRSAPATPTLQSIADAGLSFSNAWTMPACSTARGVLYTGRYPFRTNMRAALGPSDLANSMISPYENTLPKIMSRVGYQTALFGKFHIGLQGKNPYGLGMPNALGWDYFSGWLDDSGDPETIDTTAGGVGPVGTYVQGYVPGKRNGGADWGACYAPSGRCKPLSSEPLAKNPAGRACRDSGGIFVPEAACSSTGADGLGFSTLSAHYVSPLVINEDGRVYEVPPTDSRARTFRNVQQTDAAISWIKKQQRSRKRWFATVALASVHTPMQAPPVSTLPVDAQDSNGLDPASVLDGIVLANQMIQGMDSELERLFLKTGLATKRNGRLALTAASANTVVIYVNDNGSLGTQVRLPFDGARSKGTAYQTGVWTPVIVAGPIVKTPGGEVTAMVNIADLYEFVATLGGGDVRRNNPRPVDSVAMLPYFKNISTPSIRKRDFTLVGPNIQANGSINGPCQFANSCSHIPVTKSVCEDNGGIWFGEGATGTYPGANDDPYQIPQAFTHCCEVQRWVNSIGGSPVSVQPLTSIGVRDVSGFKLVRNEKKDYIGNACVDSSVDELYVVNQDEPLPLLDREELLIEEPYSDIQQTKFNELSTYMNEVLASEPTCPGDGNDDGVVNATDLLNFEQLRRLTTGSSWYDVNQDGYTNLDDRQTIVQNLGRSCK
jgi:hypothetical protein